MSEGKPARETFRETAGRSRRREAVDFCARSPRRGRFNLPRGRLTVTPTLVSSIYHARGVLAGPARTPRRISPPARRFRVVLDSRRKRTALFWPVIKVMQLGWEGRGAEASRAESRSLVERNGAPLDHPATRSGVKIFSGPCVIVLSPDSAWNAVKRGETRATRVAATGQPRGRETVKRSIAASDSFGTEKCSFRRMFVTNRKKCSLYIMTYVHTLDKECDSFPSDSWPHVWTVNLRPIKKATSIRETVTKTVTFRNVNL